MEQKTDLQIAEELDWKIKNIKPFLNQSKSCQILNKKYLKQAKSNLESLGCGKKTYGSDEFGWIHCGFKWGKWINKEWVLTGEIEFCHECLANGVDKAKAIYEEILK